MSEKTQPKISPDNQHFDELIWETIIVRNGQPVRQVWKFERAYFPCGRCHLPDNIKFISLPTGVYKTCKYCGFTEDASTINVDSGEERAEKLIDEVVSVEVAWATLTKHGSHPYAPLNLPSAKAKRGRLRVQ